MDHLCFLCLVFLVLSHLFIAALWSPAGKGLTSWLLIVMFIVFLLLSHVVSCVRCGTRLYRFLIFAVFLLRIEMQIFSLHWMMQNIRLFNVCEARRASRRHLNANVLHHPVQAKNLNFNPYIYILYY